jgi:hypothetical protein
MVYVDVVHKKGKRRWPSEEKYLFSGKGSLVCIGTVRFNLFYAWPDNIKQCCTVMRMLIFYSRRTLFFFLLL